MDRDWIEERIWELRLQRDACLFASGRFMVDVKLAFRVRQWRLAGGQLRSVA